jgi:D-arabinose 1-dehydrogenase-like Zn-dependent alcohol dehydrogenase
MGRQQQRSSAGRIRRCAAIRTHRRIGADALKAVVKGSVVVCGRAISPFPDDSLWGERRVVSVANLTREDGLAFMRLAADIPLKIQTTRYPMGEPNRALADLREGKLAGAGLLAIREGDLEVRVCASACR